MTPERWSQIEELFHRAAECDPEHRDHLLDEACNGDFQLRREVEVLLASEGNASDRMQAAVESGLDAMTFPLVGKTISHYRIMNGLAGGGMGLVYRAEDIKLGRQVALKFLPDESAKDPAALGRFEREARSASALEHPNLCPIYEFGEHEGQPFLVMPLLEGQTLRELLSVTDRATPLLELPQLIDLALQIIEGLDAAHRHGITHRDIKPENLFITKDDCVKILDFGLAKLLLEKGSPETLETLEALELQTHPGTIAGTVAYMSPEQVRGEKLDARTDLFSFGVVLYEMVTGKRPFEGDTSGVTFEAILNRQPTPVSQHNSKVAPGLETIISKALEKDREVRYQHASEIRADLKRFKRDTDAGRITGRPKMAGLLLAVAVLAIPAVFGYRWLQNRRSDSGRQIYHKNTIILADIANTTGDKIFNDTLRQGLSVQLEQSPFLRIISDQQIQQTLAMMGQPADARLTPTIARELCQRAGSAALLDGSIAQIGTQYVLTIRASDCASGESLASLQAQARDKNHVLDALGKAALDLRQKLGESLSSAQQFGIPLEQATTPSLEALQSYSLARKQMLAKGDNFGAVPLFERAIQLDPNFAMAYAALGTTYFNLGEHKLGTDNTMKAYELRQRLSQRERFYIEAHYCDQVTGDLEKALQVYDLWAKTYPNDDWPVNNSGEIYTQLGQYERALEEDRTVLRLDPVNSSNYADLAFDYIYLNRVGEAEATIKEALSNNLDSPKLHIRLYQLAFLRNDTAGMLRQVSWSAGEQGVEDVLLALEAETAAYGGRVTKARELSRRAIVSAQNAGEKEIAATYEVFAALRESLLGNRVEARRGVTAALRLSTGRDIQAVGALALALIGDIPRSQKLANGLAQIFPEDTIVQFNYVPTIRTQLALDGGESRKAIAGIDISARYELGDPVEGILTTAMYPIFVHGQAYLIAGDGLKSAAEFQKILDHPGVALNRPIGALAHLGLARAYRLQGNTARARAAYQDFLTLWKDADPGIPVMQQATAEYNDFK